MTNNFGLINNLWTHSAMVKQNYLVWIGKFCPFYQSILLKALIKKNTFVTLDSPLYSLCLGKSHMIFTGIYKFIRVIKILFLPKTILYFICFSLLEQGKK